MSEILVIKREDLPISWLPTFGFLSLSEEQFRDEIRKTRFLFMERGQAEKDENYKQIIPYVVMIDVDSDILCYQRNGREERLKNLYSAGIGGHIEKQLDAGENLQSLIYNGLSRELLEETGLTYHLSKVTFHGIINEEQTQAGRVHLGIVFSFLIENHNHLKVSSELHNYQFCGISEFLNHKKYEYWSGLALNLIQQKRKNRDE